MYENRKSYIGVYGLGVMGQNLALNIASHDFLTSVYNKFDFENTTRIVTSRNENIRGYEDVKGFIDSLESPRKIILMVTAGTVVDTIISEVTPLLEEGDMLIDCGNSYYEDTIQRESKLKSKGIYFFGVGVSGGAEGALKGPSIMPGGNKEMYRMYLSEVFNRIAAHTQKGVPCCSYIGEGGSGHYVKMVHNGIEYGDIQIICEAYYLMKELLLLSNEEMADVFKKWNQGRLNSYLIEITSDILLKKDEITGESMIDTVLDDAGQKGTGKWTSMESIKLNIPAPTIVESVIARYISAMKEERVLNAKLFEKEKRTVLINKDEFLESLEKAVFASKVVSYAQGFQQLQCASIKNNWELDLGEISLVWRQGCIIRAQFLERIKEAYQKDSTLKNLITTEEFMKDINEAQKSWRDIVSCAILNGFYIPTIVNSLQYFDGITSAFLPANLLQAQRDCFGSHTYHRVDKPKDESYHTEWRISC